MRRDIRETALYTEVQALWQALRQPGRGIISDASEVSTNGSHVVFAGTIVDELNGSPPTRICSTDLRTGDTRVVTFGPNCDRQPEFSPAGEHVAFLSDRREAGDFQLFLLDPISGAARPTPPVEGWVEYLHWSPNGRRILLGVAGYGADVAGGQGAVSSNPIGTGLPAWMPSVETGDEGFRWRRAWVYDLATDSVRPVGDVSYNIWEAVWCGNGAIAAVVSPGPGEGLWYTARLHIIETDTVGQREVFAPLDQLGWPAASASGRHLAFVEAVCSDRWIVAGELRLFDAVSNTVRTVDTNGVDVTCTEWQSEDHLLVAGHRGLETVVGVYDLRSNGFQEIWLSRDSTTGGRYAAVRGCKEPGDFVLVTEGFLRAPQIARVQGGLYHCVKSFDTGVNHGVTVGSIKALTWNAPDGLRIEGWLLTPAGSGPHALVMNIHGGPVWHWRPTWLGRAGLHMLMLLKKGYAVFLPNPRGSGGSGQEYARAVKGDMNGADTGDYLSGLDDLVRRGIADAGRLGVMGGSYGGNMTCWLITQDSRFAAAVALAPHTNQVTEHLLSNIPDFVDLFLADTYNNPGGKYFQRSPVMHAHEVKTPTLNVCGALDRCTPAEEAMQFHNALLRNNIKSVLVRYPLEGHGIRRLPAAIDYAARVVGWFSEHMPATPP